MDVKTMTRAALGGLLLLGGLVPVAQADGQLMVMPARSTVEAQQKRTVQVSNLGDKPLYLEINLLRLDNPGEMPEHKTPLGEIALPEMMVNPAKLTLGPGQKREINLIPLRTPTKETLYRLYIVPVSNIKVVGSAPQDKVDAPVTFGIGYGVLVHHVPPLGLQTRSWSHQCTAGGLQLQATGTMHVPFTNLVESPLGAMQLASDKIQKVFPGTPLVFPIKTLKGNVDGQPLDLRCP